MKRNFNNVHSSSNIRMIKSAEMRWMGPVTYSYIGMQEIYTTPSS